MAYQHKDNSFTLFLNDKGSNPNRPDYTGTGMIFGKEVRISVWKGTTNNGAERFSGQVTESVKKESATTEQPKAEPEIDVSAVGDDLPF